MTSGGRHTVHSGPAESVQIAQENGYPGKSTRRKRPAASNIQLTEKASEGLKNPLHAYAEALYDSDLVHRKLKALVVAPDRYGELQVMRSAVRRIELNLTAMIEAEELL